MSEKRPVSAKVGSAISDLNKSVNAFLKKPRSVEQDEEDFKRLYPDREWTDSASSLECAGCDRKFSSFVRKHHCRECGDVFCNACSSNKIVIQGALKRCCENCYNKAIGGLKNNAGNMGSYRSRVVSTSQSTSPMKFERRDSDQSEFSLASTATSATASRASRSTSFKHANYVAQSIKHKSKLPKSDVDPAPKVSSLRKKDITTMLLEKTATQSFDFPPWVDAMIYVFDEKSSSANRGGQSRVYVVHPNDALTDDMVQDIVDASMPIAPLFNDKYTGNAEFKQESFIIRTHDKTKGGVAAVPYFDYSDEGDVQKLKKEVLAEANRDYNASKSNNTDANSRDLRDEYYETPSISSNTLFYNCYVSYKERRVSTNSSGNDNTNGRERSSSARNDDLFADDDGGDSGDVIIMRHAMIMVSRWPYPQLAFYCLDKLDSVVNWSDFTYASLSMTAGTLENVSASLFTQETPADKKQPTSWDIDDDDDDDDEEDERADQVVVRRKSVMTPGRAAVLKDARKTFKPISFFSDDMRAKMVNILSTCFSQMSAFPPYTSGDDLDTIFLGEAIRYTIPMDIVPLYGQNLSLASAAVSINLLVKLAPLGLVQHILKLWELIAMGKDIVVLGNTPTDCNEVVLTLTSLLSPLGHHGDVRPYMHACDSDMILLKKMSLQKQAYREANSDANLNMKRTIKHSSIIVGCIDLNMLDLLDNFDAFLYLPSDDVKSRRNDVSYFKECLRERNSAPLYHLKKEDKASAVLKAMIRRTTSGSVDSASGRQELSTKSIFLSRYECTEKLDRQVIKSIQSLGTVVSMQVMGDRLIRDRLNTLTVLYFSPLEEGTSLELAEVHTAHHERVKIKGEQVMLQKLQDKLTNDTALLSSIDYFPQLLRVIVPTLILWLHYILFMYVAICVIDIPIHVLYVCVLVTSPPFMCPKKVERIMRKYIPLYVLYPSVFALDGNRRVWNNNNSNDSNQKEVRIMETPVDNNVEEAEENAEEHKFSPKGNFVRANLSGVWKRTGTKDYDKFIMAQGGAWFKAKMAASISLVHTITMDNDLTQFRLQEVGGPVNTDFTYVCDGLTTIDTEISNTPFKDTVSWDNNVLLVHKLVQPKQDYELYIHRYLDDENTLKVIAVFNHLTNPEKNVTAYSYFTKTGPSPHTLASLKTKRSVSIAENATIIDDDNTAQEENGSYIDPTVSTKTPGTLSSQPTTPTSTTINSGTRTSGTKPSDVSPFLLKDPRESLVGSWKRSSHHGYGNVLAVLGLTDAEQRQALHYDETITIGLDSRSQYIRVKEQTGSVDSKTGLDTDSTYPIDTQNDKAVSLADINIPAPYTNVTRLRGVKYYVMATYEHGGRDHYLKIKRKRADEKVELISTYSVSMNDEELHRTSIVKCTDGEGKLSMIEASTVYSRTSTKMRDFSVDPSNALPTKSTR